VPAYSTVLPFADAVNTSVVPENNAVGTFKKEFGPFIQVQATVPPPRMIPLPLVSVTLPIFTIILLMLKLAV